jgi:excisionase family DNA binding protein
MIIDPAHDETTWLLRAVRWGLVPASFFADHTPVGSDHNSDETTREPLMTAGEVADMLGVGVSWVYAQSREGRIPTVNLGPRYRRYRRLAIEQWIASQELVPAQ